MMVSVGPLERSEERVVTKKEKLVLCASAAELGKAAFEAGKGRAPALSAELHDLMFRRDEKLDHKASMAVMTAYTRAWDGANLAAPVV